jgi:copper(I)-binding protein
MTFKSFLLGGFSALAFASTAHADIAVEDAYARSSGPAAKTGAAFFVISNTGEVEDRLISVTTSASKVVQLHTHIAGDNGVMLMRQDKDGFEVEAGGTHALKRGGDHVMMMGLTAPFVQGETVELTLTFEHAGDMTVVVPVDNERTPKHSDMKHGEMDHSAMDHGEMKHGEVDHEAMGH